MSNSYGCETKLRELASEFYEKANELEKAADCLRDLREAEGMESRFKDAKEWAKRWLGGN